MRQENRTAARALHLVIAGGREGAPAASFARGTNDHTQRRPAHHPRPRPRSRGHRVRARRRPARGVVRALWTATSRVWDPQGRPPVPSVGLDAYAKLCAWVARSLPAASGRHGRRSRREDRERGRTLRSALSNPRREHTLPGSAPRPSARCTAPSPCCGRSRRARVPSAGSSIEG